jgi:chorismate-pyruvate lyase
MRAVAWAAVMLWLQSAAIADPRTLVAELNADLAAHPSATAVLQQWCAHRHLADPPVIVAERRTGQDKPATAEIRALLQAAPGEAIRYRRVALACGGRVLSNADNWYRPGQLTTAMNAELVGTDHPFGAVVKALNFHRQALQGKVLVGRHATRVPAEIIRNEALLETPDGTPFSLVVETYSSEAVADR